MNRAGSPRRVNRMLIASQKTNGAAREGTGGTKSAYSRRGRSKYPWLGQGLWTCAVDPVMHRCRWIVLHKFMTGKCETRMYLRTKTNRPGEYGGGVSFSASSRAMPPFDVNYYQFQRADYLPEEDRMPISRMMSLCEILLSFIQDVSASCISFALLVDLNYWGMLVNEVIDIASSVNLHCTII